MLDMAIGWANTRSCALHKAQRDQKHRSQPNQLKEHHMYATPAQFAEVQKSQLDTVYALSHAVFGAAERLTDLNLAAAKALLEESSETTQSYLGVKDVKELTSLNAGFAQ